MQYNFLNIFLDKKELQKQGKKKLNQFLLENNWSQLENIYDFYKNDNDLLFVNGFMGTGKLQIVDYSFSFLSKDAIVLNYNCFESTVLDDILLFFFSEFKKLTLQSVISEPKSKSENFTQKINSYFSSIEKPFLIVLDSFESILKENKQEILDFILHLASFSKIKIILIARSFDDDYFKNVDIKYQRIITLALDKHLFEKYLKSEKVKYSGVLLDEFYKQTRGYYFYTTLSLKLMKNKDMTLDQFLKEFRTTFPRFDDFLVKQSMDIIPAANRNLFWFLSMVRHPVSAELLKALKLYDETVVKFLIDNHIFTQDNSLIYIQDYFKEQAAVSIAQGISQRIHRFIVDLYQTQLPLKPLDRNVLISRQTMRKEIEYHNLFLPKKLKNLESQNVDVNYLSYAKAMEFDYSHLNHKTDDTGHTECPQCKETGEIRYIPVDMSSVKNVSLNMKDLPFSDKGAAGVNTPVENKHLSSSFDKAETVGGAPLREAFSRETHTDENDLGELVELAKNAEENYQYAKALAFYKKALFCNKDLNYQNNLPLIYTGIANSYEKTSDYENAIKYYDLAVSFYQNAENFVKANYIKLEIAKVFYESYKLEKSKETLLDIMRFEHNPPILSTRAYLQLANLEDNLSNLKQAFDYYRAAIKLCDPSMGVEILSELYFKYALILDDKGGSENAIEFYEKCINLSNDDNENKFLSSAYSNIATLYFERGDLENAVKNYLKTYETDKQINNYDGMYYSASKLASSLQRKQPDEALRYFKIALESAEFTHDIFYIASASLALGDFYYDKKQDEMALKQFVHVLNMVKNEFGKENIDKINMRINDIKFRLGEARFEEVMTVLREEY